MTIISGLELYLWRQQAIAQGLARGISSQEVDWVLQAVAKLDSLSLRLESFQHQPQIESSCSLSELNKLWQQRLQERLPVQYLTGTVFWRHFQLKVTPAVLIPRPETELIIDIAVDAVRSQPPILVPTEHWVDLGTGSGAIALGLATSFPQATIHAVDISGEALSVARENARNLGLVNRLEFHQGSWWTPLKAWQGQIRGMVSNPPYIPKAQLAQLQLEVVRHEPHLALDGGRDGLQAIRHLVEVAPNYLISGGIWLIEMMAGQASTVVEMLKAQGEYHQIEILTDLAGIERFALAYRR